MLIVHVCSCCFLVVLILVLVLVLVLIVVVLVVLVVLLLVEVVLVLLVVVLVLVLVLLVALVKQNMIFLCFGSTTDIFSNYFHSFFRWQQEANVTLFLLLFLCHKSVIGVDVLFFIHKEEDSCCTGEKKSEYRLE